MDARFTAGPWRHRDRDLMRLSLGSPLLLCMELMKVAVDVASCDLPLGIFPKVGIACGVERKGLRAHF